MKVAVKMLKCESWEPAPLSPHPQLPRTFRHSQSRSCADSLGTEVQAYHSQQHSRFYFGKEVSSPCPLLQKRPLPTLFPFSCPWVLTILDHMGLTAQTGADEPE